MLRPPSHALRPFALVLGVALLVSCDPDDTGIVGLPLAPGVAPANLSISPGATTLGYIGASRSLSARIVTAEGNPVTGLSTAWTALNPGVVSVNADGTVTAVTVGTGKIVARVVNLVDTATVTVERLPATVELSPDSLVFTELGATATVTASVAGGGGQPLPNPDILWSSADTSVATVTASGTVTASAGGSTTVRATGGAITASLRVRVAVGPAEVDVIPESVTFTALGDTRQLTATVRDAAGSALEGIETTYVNGDTTVATVSATGLLTATGPGNTSVVVVADTVSATVPVTVDQEPATVAVTPDTANATPGATVPFAAVATDANGNDIDSPDVDWSSSDTGVATVTSGGVATALAAGTTAIVATAGSVADTATLVVSEVAIDSISVEPDSATVEVGGAATLTASFFSAGVEITGPTGTWSSSDTSVATVDGAGQVFGLSTGAAWIFVTEDVATDSAHVTVTAPPSQFEIEVRYVGATPTAAQQAAFTAAEERWENTVIGDLTSAAVNIGAGACGIDHPALSETIDDLLIYAEVTEIDGAGGTLGQAGPCLVRTATGLAVVGVMQFDDADLVDLEAAGDLQTVVTHEMGHVLGFGVSSPWDDILVGAGTADPYFPGTEALVQYAAAGGTAANAVPVEATGGEGTQDAHWRETHMGAEMMTGFLNSGVTNPLSAITIGALEDMGYQVDITVGDDYTVAAALLAAARGRRLDLALGERLMHPRFTVDAAGRVSVLPRR